MSVFPTNTESNAGISPYSNVVNVTTPPSTPTSFTITASAGPNGSIAPSGTVTVSSGASQTLTITPNMGYHIADVLIDGASIGAVPSYTFSNVSANHTIAASFAINSYTITASAVANGAIAPSGTVSVNHGASQTFTITPNMGYRIAGVLVDGSSVGAVPSYTFSNVSANHTIVASFTTNIYFIYATAGPGGYIAPGGAAPVPYGASLTFSILPATGYVIADVLVDGVSVGPVSSYTFPPIVENHTIAASFNSSKSLTQSVLNGLTALQATVADKQDRQKIEEALKHLNKSLTPSWWLGSTHLQPKEGGKVFNENKDAINQLRNLIKDKKGSISDATIQQFIDSIVKADRLLAVVAITGATGVDPKAIGKANEELAHGDSDASLGKHNSAIEHYRNAWQHVQP